MRPGDRSAAARLTHHHGRPQVLVGIDGSDSGYQTPALSDRDAGAGFDSGQLAAGVLAQLANADRLHGEKCST